MSDEVKIAIIAAAPAIIVGVLNYLQQRKVKSDMNVVKEQTNHIKDQLIASTAKASHAEGVRDEKIRVAVEQNVPVNAAVTPPASPPVLPSP